MSIAPSDFENAKKIATRWQEKISQTRSEEEKKFHTIMMRMLKDPMNKVFLIDLLDQSFRSQNNHRVANQLAYLFDKYDGTDIFTAFESYLIWMFRNVGIYFPNLSVPLFINYLRNDISNIVIRGEETPLIKHIRKRKAEGTRVNINIIGEAVLGEKEASERMEKYTQALKNPDIDYISIKISTIFSQITPIAHQWSVDQIASRLEVIYQTALSHKTIINGKSEPKFINLDMEEYRDLHLTVDAFIQTLSKPAFQNLHAGIVIQAYLPESLIVIKKLTAWAKERVQQGGASIKIRLVKGANQEMELTEASLRGWPCVTYTEKSHSDANYKRCMDYLIDPTVAPYVATGIASHNLFDQALGMVLAKERGVLDHFSAEMLEGMSDTAYHVLKQEGLNVILYAPTATAKTFTNAIAYLVRRFDENTASQNFLRHSFGLETGTPAWHTLVKSYDDAVDEMENIARVPFRTQDRNSETFTPITQTDEYAFANESDTDFALPHNVRWAEAICNKYRSLHENGGFHAQVIVGAAIVPNLAKVEIRDKSQYHDNIIIGTYAKADQTSLQKAVEIAKADPDGWRNMNIGTRQKLLMQTANVVRKKRGDLIGIAAAEVGKVFTETDVEVSEAIDFLNFYPYSVQKIAVLEGISVEGKGVGVVVSPWNFPVAIPCGGIAAALAAGNTVILKPASNAVLTAYMLCQCFWEAGVSQNVLQFVPTDGALAGEHLIAQKEVDFVILTGGEETAYRMIKQRPDIHLSAETGGKDATIVTAMADRDSAVKNVVASAFNNSGQKCSATSLLVLEKELFEDAHFKAMLVDAASSLEVGSVWDLQNRIGTLSDLPSGDLEKSLDYLDEGESWALAPSYADNNPYMLKPSIRWGTQHGDFCHMNELFGPVLSVMCAEDLEEAIQIVNATGYGLTSGIESLDEREQKHWLEKIIAGNLYLNRPTTGAIVRRQPFGGMRKSAIGSGKKAGGFNYTSQFMDIRCAQTLFEEKAYHILLDKLKALDKESFDENTLQDTQNIVAGFAYWLKAEFSQMHDYSHIRGESNHIRYLPLKNVLLRISSNCDDKAILSSICAIKMTGASLLLSVSPHESKAFTQKLASIQSLLDSGDRIKEQDETTLIQSMKETDHIRFLDIQSATASLYAQISSDALYISVEPFTAHGRIELMHYFVEQSVSNSFHRYGNLGIKGLEKA